MQGLLPSHRPPRQWQEGINEHETQHRRKNAQETPTIERTHALTRWQRREQEGRSDHEQGYASTCDTSIEECHPKAILLCCQQRHIACQARAVRAIEILTCVNQHDKETSNHSQVVYEDYSLFFHIKGLFL